MVAKENDRRCIVDRSVAADELIEEDRRHGSHVFVAKTQVGAGETRISRLDSFYSNFFPDTNHVPRENLFCQRHWTLFGFNGWKKNLALHAGDIEIEQPAVFNDLPGDFVFTLSKFRKRHFLSAANGVNQRKVRGRQHAQVLAILLVSTF